MSQSINYNSTTRTTNPTPQIQQNSPASRSTSILPAPLPSSTSSKLSLDRVLRLNSISPLHQAIHKEDWQQARILILTSPAPSLNLQDHTFKTPLHLLIQENQTDLTLLLIEKLHWENQYLGVQDGDGNSALHLAVEFEDTKITKALLERSPASFCNLQDKYKATPLIIAAAKGMVDILQDMTQKLIKENEVTNQVGYNRYTCLHFLIDNNLSEIFPEFVDIILEKRENLEIAEQINRSTPLHLAIHFKQQKLALRLTQILSSHPKDLEVQDKYGDTPLHLAIQTKNRNVAKLLIQNYSAAALNTPNKEGKTPLHLAIETKQTDLALLLIEKLHTENKYLGMQDAKGNSPLHLSVEFRNAQVTRALLERCPASLCNLQNKAKSSPLLRAAATSQIDSLESMTQKLIEAGEVLNLKGYLDATFLHYVIQNNLVEKLPKFIDLLLEKGENLHIAEQTHGTTPLHLAICHGNSNLALRLISLLPPHSEHLLIKDKLGNTPLHDAARLGMKDVVAALIEKLPPTEIDYNLRNNRENTPLDEALENGHEEITLALIFASRMSGVDLNQQNRKGNTPLHVALIKKMTKASLVLTRLLSQESEDLEKRNTGLNSPLHLSIIHNQPTVALTLLEQPTLQNATLTHKNNQGKTPLHLALEKVISGDGASRHLFHHVVRALLNHLPENALLIRDQGGITPLELLQQAYGHLPNFESIYKRPRIQNALGCSDEQRLRKKRF